MELDLRKRDRERGQRARAAGALAVGGTLNGYGNNPFYVPANLWGGSPYWQGQGYVGQGDPRYLGAACSGQSTWQYRNCYIRHGSPGWTAPYAANTQFPHYVPASMWGGQPYWMGQGYVAQGDTRYLGSECAGSHRNHRHCYIRHGSPGWVAPYVAANTNFRSEEHTSELQSP